MNYHSNTHSNYCKVLYGSKFDEAFPGPTNAIFVVVTESPGVEQMQPLSQHCDKLERQKTKTNQQSYKIRTINTYFFQDFD